MEATMGKMDIKELMAQTREIARQPSKQTEKEDTAEPVTVPETDSQSTDKITVPEGSDTEEEKPAQKQKPAKEKKHPMVQAHVDSPLVNAIKEEKPAKKQKPIREKKQPTVQAHVDSPLINAIKEYDPGTETQRMTYIINEANYIILSAIKAESKTSIMSLINFFLDEALKGRSEEINKLIHKQYKNLKL
jgi:hypothetical protein